MVIYMAERKVLIKYVVQDIPTYCMNIFQIPQLLGDKLQKMMNSYWWGLGKRGRKGVNWMVWDRLCVMKEKLGLGFRNLFAFNFAMLGKQ